MKLRRAILAAFAALMAACAAPLAAAQSNDRTVARPPGAKPDPKTVEGGLWDVAARMEQDIKSSGVTEKDPALNAYVRDVACKLVAEYCSDLRLYVIDQPVWNAFMAPNGASAFYTGLMLRMDNEAQFACVVGHEAGHFIQNHSLESFRAVKNRANLAMIAQLGAAAAGAPAVAGDVISLAAFASIMSYSRANESEADRIGFDRIAAAGLATSACADVWRDLLGEFEASDVRATRRRADGDTRFLDSHPGAAERMEVLESFAKERPGGVTQDDRYRAAVRPFLSAWLRADLRRKDFGGSLHLLERRIAQGKDLGVYVFFQGEAYRLRRKEGDLKRARAAYDQAIAQPDAPAEAWRELGYLKARDGDKVGARLDLTTYLAKAPAASDRLLVESDMKGLGAP
ncbi:MAG: M48 family metallopeptidase [Caulobacterales bacterium]